MITLLVDKWCCNILWSPSGGAAAILRFGQKIGRKSLYKKTYVQLQEQRVWAIWDRWNMLKLLVDTSNLRQALDLLGVPIASSKTVLTNTPTSTLQKAQDPTWSLVVIVQSHLSTWEVSL